MLFKLNYICNTKTFNSLVTYDGKKYIMLKVCFINSCTEPYLENVKIKDYFICTDIDEENIKNFMSIRLCDWMSSYDGKHHNFDNNNQTILIKLNY